jgi:hypothetical protein
VEDEVDEELYKMAAARKAEGGYLAGLRASLGGAWGALGGVGATWNVLLKRLRPQAASPAAGAVVASGGDSSSSSSSGLGKPASS